MTLLDTLRLVAGHLFGNAGAVENCRNALVEAERADRAVRALRCRVTDDGNGAVSVAAGTI